MRSTRLVSMALIMDAHRAASASENQSPRNGRAARPSRTRCRDPGCRHSATPAAAAAMGAATASHTFSLNQTPVRSTASARSGSSFPSSSRLENWGMTKTNTSSTAVTPDTTRIDG